MSNVEGILQYSHVDICYNRIPAVCDVSFTLEKGEILGIVGESGSGKSTLIRAAMGLLGPNGLVTGGNIWYQGINLPDLSVRAFNRINGTHLAMIFQNAGSSFCPIRTVGSQLLEAVRAHERIGKSQFRARAVKLLNKIGFEDPQRVLDSYPFELSGGMNQRVGIAAAMLMRPEILLADEPTSALDASVQKQVVEEMLLLRRLFHTSMILVSHNIGVVRAVADKVLVMCKGTAVEYGPAKQVLEQPAQDYTRTLIAAVPVLRRS